METHEILTKLKTGELSIDEAEKLLKHQPFDNIGYARLDTHRKIRSGFAEVIYCSGKTKEHLLGIYRHIVEKDGEILGTRATQEQYEYLKPHIKQLRFDPISGILSVEKSEKKKIGKIVVCTAGTSDIPVAEECAQTAEYFGTNVVRLYDAGVSGLHRLLSSLDAFHHAHCVVAIAGMEGALASVLGGLVDVPVIAVPTSVGYGASFHGVSALLTMINSCANGIATVNIDNGYGAGYLATQINRIGEGYGK